MPDSRLHSWACWGSRKSFWGLGGFRVVGFRHKTADCTAEPVGGHGRFGPAHHGCDSWRIMPGAGSKAYDQERSYHPGHSLHRLATKLRRAHLMQIDESSVQSREKYRCVRTLQMYEKYRCVGTQENKVFVSPLSDNCRWDLRVASESESMPHRNSIPSSDTAGITCTDNT